MTGPPPSTIPEPSIGGRRSLEYWGNTTADITGMLGGVPDISGFSSINRIDLQGSRTVLARFGIGIKGGRQRVKRVLEGGAGWVFKIGIVLGSGGVSLTRTALSRV